MIRVRMALAVAGLAIALIGIATDNREVVWLAIGTLALSVALRLAERWRERRRSRGEDGTAGEEP